MPFHFHQHKNLRSECNYFFLYATDELWRGGLVSECVPGIDLFPLGPIFTVKLRREDFPTSSASTALQWLLSLPSSPVRSGSQRGGNSLDAPFQHPRKRRQLSRVHYKKQPLFLQLKQTAYKADPTAQLRSRPCWSRHASDRDVPGVLYPGNVLETFPPVLPWNPFSRVPEKAVPWEVSPQRPEGSSTIILPEARGQWGVMSGKLLATHCLCRLTSPAPLCRKQETWKQLTQQSLLHMNLQDSGCSNCCHSSDFGVSWCLHTCISTQKTLNLLQNLLLTKSLPLTSRMNTLFWIRWSFLSLLGRVYYFVPKRLDTTCSEAVEKLEALHLKSQVIALRHWAVGREITWDSRGFDKCPEGPSSQVKLPSEKTADEL